jgi:hypothetical protein
MTIIRYGGEWLVRLRRSARMGIRVGKEQSEREREKHTIMFQPKRGLQGVDKDDEVPA